ncbi:hypothetical protein A2U01_0095002, partial [Trifolium medium]|nr:hypothetical protein [Trifolium medium]
MSTAMLRPGQRQRKEADSVEGGAGYPRRLIIVFLIVERLNRLIICSSPTALSVPIGLLSVLGLTLH